MARGGLLSALKHLGRSDGAEAPDADAPGADADEAGAREDGAAEIAALARWRAARLASLAHKLGRFGHDMRGILSPALLAAERLQGNADPAVRRAADTLVRAVERATAAIRDDLAAIRAEVPPVRRAPLDLREALDALAPDGLAIDNAVPPGLMVAADPAHLTGALDCLLAHARRCGAERLTAGARMEARCVVLAIDHPGAPRPGMPPCFDPPAGPSGAFELATARDFFSACGAEIAAAQAGGFVVTFDRA